MKSGTSSTKLDYLCTVAGDKATFSLAPKGGNDIGKAAITAVFHSEPRTISKSPSNKRMALPQAANRLQTNERDDSFDHQFDRGPNAVRPKKNAMTTKTHKPYHQRKSTNVFLLSLILSIVHLPSSADGLVTHTFTTEDRMPKDFKCDDDTIFKCDQDWEITCDGVLACSGEQCNRHKKDVDTCRTMTCPSGQKCSVVCTWEGNWDKSLEGWSDTQRPPC